MAGCDGCPLGNTLRYRDHLPTPLDILVCIDSDEDVRGLRVYMEAGGVDPKRVGVQRLVRCGVDLDKVKKPMRLAAIAHCRVHDSEVAPRLYMLLGKYTIEAHGLGTQAHARGTFIKGDA
jgi:hypothetical protein